MGRTVVVGDVHGCAWELETLLDRVGFSSGDRLVFVGDLIARGPDSRGVLDIARRTGALIVRGNHEQKLLAWRAARRLWMEEPFAAFAGRREIGALEEESQPLGRMHREVARDLRPIDWTLLESSSYWLDLPEHGLRVVHAGVDPAVAFEKQKLATLLRIRSVPVARVRKRRGPREWALWGACYQGPPQVVFGHNAAPGLQLHPWATGLDTGCVYGGRLTAMVLGEGQKVPRAYVARRRLLVSEPSRRIYFDVERRKRVT
jgi:hypothetical protein